MTFANTRLKSGAIISFSWGRGIVALSLLALSACTFLQPPEPYLPNRATIIPGQTITVKGNENIYLIAHEHSVSMRELIVLNNLRPPYEVRRGEKLVLPAGGTNFSGEANAPEASPLAPVDRNALAPIVPAPVSSEELEPITTVSLAPTTNLKTGVQPMGAAPAAPQTSVSPAAVQKQAATTMTSVESVETATIDVSTTMRWPVQGPILSSFGSKGAGLTNDGINIGAPKGAPVVASAPGTVVYAGNDMKGFGNLVLIRHQGEMVTAYAHLDRVLVKKDSIVAQGDMIGTVGKTGRVSSPQLHFEVRIDGKPVDPAQQIKKEL